MNFTEELPLAPGARLEMDLGRVEAVLVGGERDDVTVRASVPVQLVPVRGGVRLTARRQGPIRMEIAAPRKLALAIADERSQLSIRGFEGSLALATQAGRIEGSDLRGELDLRVERGHARLRDVLARVLVSCGRGRVELGLLGVHGESRIRVDGGRVDLDVPEGLDASFGTRVRRPWQSLTVRADFGAGGAPVELEVRRGEVRLFRDGEWRGTLGPRGEVRLKGWDERRRRHLRELVSRLHDLRSLARR